jgi:type I restriction enzyme M protein
MTSITGELKGRIDKLWLEFWTGGIANPLSVIEQISFLMFARLLDMTETRNERMAKRTGKDFVRIFPETEDGQKIRWQNFKQLSSAEMLKTVRDDVFPHFRTIAAIETAEGKQKTTFHEYFKDAQLLIQKPSLLVSAVNMIDDLPLDEGDTKGDLYEYLLSKLTTAGINGQFRTPRHIIQLMVEMVAPQPTETVVDPACGTGGFLVETMAYLRREHTSTEGVHEQEVEGAKEKIYSGDLLEPHREHIQTNMFHGFDFDATMLRIAAMNLLLHGLQAPNIHYQDTLGGSFRDNFPQLADGKFDVVLANPPFKGALDYDEVEPALLRKVKTKKTELLFIALILRMLANGGRCAMIVPDGVLFGSSKAHQAIRSRLIDENQLEAVISLPSGVFKPYAGVSTAILIFTKGGRTDNVWFFDLQDDGFSLDDKRTQLYGSRFAGDLPKGLVAWKNKDPKKDTDRTAQAFFVSAEEIRKNKFDLSMSHYKEVVYKAESYDSPADIITSMKALEADIRDALDELQRHLQ